MKPTAWLTCVLATVMLAFPASAGADEIVSTSGSGWIATAGGRGSFGVFGALKEPATLIGDVVYIDHGIDLRVKSTEITSYAPGCTSEITGAGKSNLGPVNFTVEMTDNGEPALGDTFSIAVTGATTYGASGILGGGNIQTQGVSCPP